MNAATKIAQGDFPQKSKRRINSQMCCGGSKHQWHNDGNYLSGLVDVAKGQPNIYINW